MNKSKTPLPLTLIWISIFMLSSCTSLRDVLPKQGPSMETIYDGLDKKGNPPKVIQEDNHEDDFITPLKNRRKIVTPITENPAIVIKNKSLQTNWMNFHKVPNPTLTLYIYPHLAGSVELPIPGYTTSFNAYEKDHYALPNEI